MSAKFGRFVEMVVTTNNSITPSEINKNDPYLLGKLMLIMVTTFIEMK